ncbi:MAG: SMC family ATPase, partial [Selenomonadaceae bacterium]|nr:SMC family ATPase [Selenomonadaceae bacterium]
MKPLKLKMQAFGPYVKQVEIDFETGLQGSNFFLIHGATGSGKTTILDAICYALYGKCSGENRTGEMMRSEKADISLRTEVDFTFALNGKIYRVIRNPKGWRESRRGDGYVEDKAAVKIYEDGKAVVVDKNFDFFQNLLQFNVNQFRQVVLLPQGEFRKFLMSNSGERGEILNVIFNADLYKAVENKLKEKAKDAALNFSDIENRRKNLLDEAKSLTDSDAESFDESAIDAQIEKFAADLKTFDAEIVTLKSQADTAAAILADGKALHADFEKRDKSAKNLSDAKIALTDAEKNFNAAQERYNQVKADEPRLSKLDAEINELSKIQGNVTDLQAAQKKLADAEKAELDSKNELTRLKKTKVNYEKRLAELKADVAKYEGADVKLSDAEKKLDDAKYKQEKLDKLASLKKELTAAENRLKVAQKNFDDAKLKLDRLNALQKLCTAAKLAATLKDGEPCPVCGSTVHPHLAVSEEVIPTDEDIERAENILEKRRMERDLATTAPAKITGKIAAIEDALKKYVDTLSVDAAQKLVDAAKAAADKLDDSRERLKKGEDMTQELYKKIDEVTAKV